MDQAREQLIKDFQKNRLRMVAYIRTLTGDSDTAEDVFQELTLVVLQKISEFRLDGDFPAWCRGIARNLARREKSKSRRLVAIEDPELLSVVDKAFDEAAQRELLDTRRTQMRQCMEKLAPNNHELLNQRYVLNLSLKQLAARLNRSEGSVQVALSRIRKTITECVERNHAAEALE
ncbi:MAG TPA: sigma-70 family RNA polymerase sigma factor [Planctomycetota bacterium]|nr:sigma-70 family RNA polymerase sigma factor [Planctomycetota bacterium]